MTRMRGMTRTRRRRARRMMRIGEEEEGKDEDTGE